MRRKVSIFGATGSVGRNTVSLIEAQGGPEAYEVVALSGSANIALLADQARRLQARIAVTSDAGRLEELRQALAGSGTEAAAGTPALLDAASEPVDWVMSAIVGAAGLAPGMRAVRNGGVLALANKESLVCAGDLLQAACKAHGTALLPVDSEHSAIFQCLRGEKQNEIKRIILTASGGPFRTTPLAELKQVTLQQALKHPTWDMGPKITIDSSTLFNKALEVIEARWLFDVAPDQIDVVVHPQSVVHSLVEYVDGSIVAQLSPPDMKLPIQYALTWPHRAPSPAPTIDLSHAWRLEFEPPDEERFPALRLGRQVAASGGTAGAALNAANEAAVAEFLAGRLQFMEIVPACESVLQSHHFEPNPTLEQLLAVDRWARKEITQWVCT